MIIKGGSRKNGAFFARHLMNEKDNERVRVVEVTGFAHDDIGDAFRDMKAIARGTRCENYFYHADMNPREGEHLTEAQWAGAVDTLEKELGFDGQPRLVFEHVKEGRTHRHVIWQRVDVDSMTALPDSLTYQKHERAARQIETDCGLEPVESVLVKDRKEPRPERRPKDFEGFRGVQSGLTPDQVKAEVTALWQRTDSGAAFRAALEENGYILCRGDRRDFCVVDPAGDEHSLARRIQGVKAAEIRERLGDINRDELPTVAEGRKLADAWGETDSDAARAVRWKEAQERLEPLRRAIETEGMVKAINEPETPVQGDWWEREQRAQAHWSPLEKAAQEYAGAVKDVARAGQDAYWQAMIGGKPKTEADKLHDLMWGEGKKEPEMER